VRDYQAVQNARKSIWWFWVLFVFAGYGVFFDTYKLNGTLSWPSRAAVGTPIGIAVGNFVQFGVFVLTAAYLVLVKHYFRVTSVWKYKHVPTE
jgi:hypothetical protein